MTKQRFRARLAATVTAAAIPTVALAGAAAASSPALVPDDLAFLDNSTIDDLVASSENGSADCAALEMVMTIGFISAFASADFDFGDPDTDDAAPATTEPQISADAFWAISAPVFVPVLARANTEDPAAAAFVDIVGSQLVGSIYELRDLGLTDDDLLLIQESFAEDTLSDDAMFGSDDTADDDAADVPDTVDPAMANLEARAEDLLSHDFESITFLDEGIDDTLPGMESETLPWEESCPTTAAMFDFDVDVSATFEFDATMSIPVITTG